MVVKVENTNKVMELFHHWQETIIWSCLQGIMGEVYADDLNHPQSAMAVLGDFCFFAGLPSKELILYRASCCVQDFMIMVPQNEQWASLIVDRYGHRAKAITRYAIKKEGDIFDRKQLQQAVNSLPSEYSLQMIDEGIFHLCKSNRWSRDLVSQYTDYEMYRRLGIGVVIVKDNLLVSGASAYSRYIHGIEVEIDTREGDRGKGFAYVCGAKLILECLKRKLYPSWDAHNKVSVALAQKLGYHFSHEYLAFEVTR